MGKPLIQWTFEQVNNAQFINHIFVSTDDDRVMEIAKEFDIKVINRPTSLCTDDATSESALSHALEVINNDYSIIPDVVVFLQATSPLRTKDDIDDSIKNFISEKADSLFSVTKLDDLTIWQKKDNCWVSINFDYLNRKRRQEMTSNYIENGSIYIFKPEILKKYNNRLGGKITTYEMKFWQTWEIDSINEIDMMEYLIKKNKLNNYE